MFINAVMIEKPLIGGLFYQPLLGKPNYSFLVIKTTVLFSYNSYIL